MIVVALLALSATVWSFQLVGAARYHPEGHEEVWILLSHGDDTALQHIDEFSVPAFPRGLAELLSHTPAAWRDDRTSVAFLGNSLVSWVWLLLNRFSLGLWIIALALVATSIGGPRAGPPAALLAAAVPAATAWSTTCYGVMPALAFGTLAVSAGLQDRRGTALFLSVVVLGTRPETAPLALASVLLPRGPILPPQAGERALGALGIGLASLLFVTQQDGGVARGLDDGFTTLRANVEVFALGAPLISALPLIAGGFLLAFAAVRPGSASSAGHRRPLAILGVCAVAASASLLTPLDLGARHFLPLITLVIGLLACVGAPRRETPSRVRSVLMIAFVSAFVGVGLKGQVELVHRMDRDGARGALPEWRIAAEQGETRTVAAVAAGECAVAFPSLTEVGATPFSSDPGSLESLWERRLSGGCVLYAVGAEEMTFGADTRSERFDRARLLLRLEPVGWIAPTTDGAPRWMLWGSD
jgi:hypothetical protein